MRLLTPPVFEALKSALTVEASAEPSELAKCIPGLNRHSGRLEVLKMLGSRPLIVNFQVSGREVRVGCGDGIMSDFEIEAFREYGEIAGRTREEVSVKEVELVRVKGLGYVEEEKVGDLPRGVLPVSSVIELLYLPRSGTVIFPYRFSRVRLDEHRELRFVLPRNFLRKRLRAVHPTYRTIYSGEVVGVEVGIGELIQGSYPQLGVIPSMNRLRGMLSVVRVLGDEDLRELLSSLGD